MFKGKGTYEFKEGKIDFEWNMLALTNLGDVTGLTINGMIKSFSDPSFRFLADFLYVGAKKEGLTRDDAVDLLEEMGIEKALHFLGVAFLSSENGKKQKPQEMGL